MPLNEVQVKFVNETYRVALENLIAGLAAIDTFSVDYNSIQTGQRENRLPVTTDVLDDAVGGRTPRTDAPNIRGSDISEMASLATAMGRAVPPEVRNRMIGLMVRDLRAVTRG